MFKICIKISGCWFNSGLIDLSREEEQMGSTTAELQKVRHIFHWLLQMGLGILMPSLNEPQNVADYALPQQSHHLNCNSS